MTLSDKIGTPGENTAGDPATYWARLVASSKDIAEKAAAEALNAAFDTSAKPADVLPIPRPRPYFDVTFRETISQQDIEAAGGPMFIPGLRRGTERRLINDVHYFFTVSPPVARWRQRPEEVVWYVDYEHGLDVIETRASGWFES